MRVRIAVPEEHVTPDVIDSGLETLTRLNERLILSGRVPTFDEALKAGRVKWKPESNPGEEHFDHAGIVLARGWGDCDDLGPWKAASLRVTGEDRGAFSRIVRTGPQTWHAIVNRSNGALQDPSRDAGMGKASISGDGMPIGGAAPVTAPMFGREGPAVAVNPWRGLWFARADLPWAHAPSYAYSATALAETLPAALHNAIVGACYVGHQAGWATQRDVAKFFVTDAIAQGVDAGTVVRGMVDGGMSLDVPAWNRAARVGSVIRDRQRRMAARV